MLNGDIGSKGGGKESEIRALSVAWLFPVVTVSIAICIGSAIGWFGSYVWIGILGFLVMTFIFLLHQDELAVTILVMIHLYVDWYLALHLVGLMLILVLLVLFFLFRSSQRPWVEPRSLWLWLVLLALALLPASQGALTLYDATTFYPSNFLGAFLVFWLGTLLARDPAALQRFFIMFAALAVLLAVHTLIQSITGIVLFQSARAEVFLATVTDYKLGNFYRSGSFFVDPNWNGSLLATLTFLPLGLCVASSSLWQKLLYLAATFLVVVALLSTFSTGALLGMAAGFLIFLVLVGSIRSRILMLVFVLGSTLGLLFLFPSEITVQLQHASDPEDVALRVAAWQTALRVIQAFPLTGVGLGYQAYGLREEPYRVPAQFVPLSHPHNSYLELGAMAGLPVLILFLALLLRVLWFAWWNWKQAPPKERSLIGAGIASAVALSVNSWTINGWTQPVIGMTCWLILGVVSSPLLLQSLKKKTVSEECTL
jgi:O-antigen ligase